MGLLMVVSVNTAETELKRQVGEPPLDVLQRLVAGPIELVGQGVYEGQSWQCICNEEGKIHGLPANPAATGLLNRYMPGFANRDILVGTVVFLHGDAMMT